MTEEEWLETRNPGVLLEPRLPVDPNRMLKHASDRYIATRKRRSGERKLRLFTCACCYRHWSLLSGDARAAVSQAEEFAEGRLEKRELDALRRSANLPASGRDPNLLARWAIDKLALAGAYHAARMSEDLSRPVPDDLVALFEMAALVREIFGNPFRSIKPDPEWRTSTVVALARGLYENRDFSPMPLLADALQDAGCENEDILNHCRSAGPHVRGCWVVDLVLGKE